MSHKINLLIIFLFLSTGWILHSCKEDKPTQGSLGITVLKSDGTPVSGDIIYISKSLQDLQNRIYSDSNWTDATGTYRFHKKDPGIYWYQAKYWMDIGAARVLNGIDVDVILWVNTPDTTIHK